MKLTTFLHLTFWLIIVSVSSLSAQNKEIEKVFSKENSLKKIPNFYLPEVSDLKVIKELPDALLGVKTYKDWAVRRQEIAAQIQHYGIGEKPSAKLSSIRAELTLENSLKFNISDRFAISVVGNHGHCQLPEEQFHIVKKFIDKFLLEK